MFQAVAARYDLLNRLFTWGLDRRWRARAAKECLAAGDPKKFLDLCTGTGDLALAVARLGPGKLEIVGLDFSAPMLAIARIKANRRAPGRITFIHGDAAEIPFRDGYFDSVGAAFAFRNLTYKNRDAHRFLDEINRVLKPGGRLVSVESSQPLRRWLKRLFRFYVHAIVYPLGKAISGNQAAYQYLIDSVINYYAPEEIVELLQQHGFSSVTFRRLLGGAAALHLATKRPVFGKTYH